MTEKLYVLDAYLKTFEATVTQVDAETRTIYLDRSAFYPGGGGQPYDMGSLSLNDNVLPVVKMSRDMGHIVGAGDLPSVGATVQGELDWERRYKLMRTHTAMHILSGVVWHDFDASVTGGNMEPLSARMDFEFGRLEQPTVEAIEQRINQEVANARDIKVAIHPREAAMQIPDLVRTKVNLLPNDITEIRTVEIVGLDLQADGGTHVHNTCEVGQIRIVKYKSKGGINKRLYVEIGDV